MSHPIDVSYDRYRPRACAFFAGRAWYAGISSGQKLGWVLFSQVLSEIENIGKCYQENDPTSEVFSDLLDSDGGLIQIPEAGEIVSLQPVGPSLFVLASNGVWQIVGGESGFTAASYMVEKVSGVGCIAANSVVPVEDGIYYWANAGIHYIAFDPAARQAASTNITDTKIKTFYRDIPAVNKLYVEGRYNSSTKTIKWGYYSVTLNGATDARRYLKDKYLVLDLRMGSFYIETLNSTLAKVVSFISTKETSTTELTYEVVAGADDVIAVADNVQVDLDIVGANTKQWKYLTLSGTPYSVTFSDLLNVRTNTTRWKDWYTVNSAGVEKAAYVVTGYNMAGVGPARAKTASYVTMFMKRTETVTDASTLPVNQSGILMQTRWDFTDDTGAGKWGQEYQVYRQLRPYYLNPFGAVADGYPLVITKNKVRGRGKALQIKLSAETGKNMVVYGWSTTFVGNTNT